jgi:flagellar basal-body rod protein FlgF
MDNTTYIALSRQTALWRQMEVVANNMANANTPAYKGQQVMFREFLIPTRTGYSPTGNKLSFVQDMGQIRDTREGPLTKTDNSLDFALHGDGYFEIETEAGLRYTRNGHFRLDEGGMLTNSSGYAVMDSRGQPIIFAPNETSVNVSPDGTVQTENGVVGKIKVVRFGNEQELRNAGDGLYDTTESPEVMPRPEIVQGMVEDSNIQPVVEMTKMMTVLREYEHNQQIIQAEFDRHSRAIQVLASVQNA